MVVVVGLNPFACGRGRRRRRKKRNVGRTEGQQKILLWKLISRRRLWALRCARNSPVIREREREREGAVSWAGGGGGSAISRK